MLKILGRHVRVGKLSEKVQQSMLKAGIKKSRFKFLTEHQKIRKKRCMNQMDLTLVISIMLGIAAFVVINISFDIRF